VSGESVTQTPGAWTPLFARYKGETEVALLSRASASKGAFTAYCARAGGVDPRHHAAIRPFMASTFRNRTLIPLLFPPLGVVWKNGLSPTKELGEVLTELAMGDGKPIEEQPGVLNGGYVLRNTYLRKKGGLD
jgi:hypothetical protein